MNQIFSVLSPMRSGVGLKPRGDLPPSGNENADVNLLLNSAAGRTMFLTPTKSRSTSPASDPELDMPDLNSPAQQVTAPAPTTFAPTADEEVDYASVFPDFATGSQFSQVMAQLVRVVSDLDHPATSTHGQAMYQPTVRPSLVHRSSSKDLASGDSAVSSPNSRAKSPSVGQDADATTSPSPPASPSSLSRRRSAHEIALESSLRLSAPAEEEESSSDESSSDEEDEEEDDDEFEDMGFDDGENHVPRHFRSPTFDKFDKMLSPNSRRLSSAVDCNAVYAQYLAMRAHRSGSTAVGGRRGSAPKAGAAAPGAMPSVSGKVSLSQVETRNRSKMCQELVSTERAYVASLSTLLKLYVQPLSDPALQKALGVSGEHITACFSNVQMIAGLHQQFLARLESATEDELFDVFVKQADFLKIYADFVGKFDTHTLRYLQQLNANKNFEAFCHAQEQQPESNGLPLNSLLIMPVQRVPRYQLLISGILKLTPADHATFDSVTRAHDKIKAIANHINESKRQVEQMDKLHTIQQQIRNLDRVLIQPWRRFIRTATAVRVSKSREYVFFLFNDLLLWISASSKQFKGVVEMQHAELPSREEVDEDDDGAQCTENELTIYCSQGSVTTPRVLTISFDSAHTRDKWAADIAKCISWSKRMQAYRLIRTNFASTGAERALSPVAASWMDTAPQPVEVTAPPQRKA